jgi:hypothetical protein
MLLVERKSESKKKRIVRAAWVPPTPLSVTAVSKRVGGAILRNCKMLKNLVERISVPGRISAILIEA